METKPAPRAGAIATVSNIAIYGATLPRVAVLELDRLVEDPADIWALAEAVVAPDRATETTRARWRHIINELGRTPDSPPIPKVGHRSLVEALERAVALKPSPKARTVTSRLIELVAIYDAVGQSGSPESAALIAPARARFATAVMPLVKARLAPESSGASRTLDVDMRAETDTLRAFALEIAPAVGVVAAYCDKIEHNEPADAKAIVDAGAVIEHAVIELSSS